MGSGEKIYMDSLWWKIEQASVVIVAMMLAAALSGCSTTTLGPEKRPISAQDRACLKKLKGGPTTGTTSAFEDAHLKFDKCPGVIVHFNFSNVEVAKPYHDIFWEQQKYGIVYTRLEFTFKFLNRDEITITGISHIEQIKI